MLLSFPSKKHLMRNRGIRLKISINVLIFILAVIFPLISFYFLSLNSQWQLRLGRFPLQLLQWLGHVLGKVGEVYRMSGVWYLQVLGLLPVCLQKGVSKTSFGPDYLGVFFSQEPFPKSKTDNIETGLALSVLHCLLWLCQKTALPMFKIPTYKLRNLVLDFCYGSRTGLLS